MEALNCNFEQCCESFPASSIVSTLTFLLQAWWGCYHCLLSFTVDPMTCSVPISDVVLPRQPIVKKIHAQARTKSTAASLAKRLNSVCTISSKWLNLNYWLRFCINQLSRAFLCREQTLSAWTILQEMQFSALVGTGTKKAQKPVVLCMGFKYSFLGLLESKRAADKSYEVDSCVWCYLSVGEFHPHAVKFLPETLTKSFGERAWCFVLAAGNFPPSFFSLASFVGQQSDRHWVALWHH